jgi:hypothetical protein
MMSENMLLKRVSGLERKGGRKRWLEKSAKQEMP